VSNAVHFTARGGIVIGCRRRGAHVRIDVYDTGPGIPQEQQVRIFGEFVQLVTPEADRQSTVGLGLGLAIVHRLAELLGHPVELGSRLDRGSRFSVSVPLVPEEREAAGIPELAAGVSDPVHGKLIMVIDDDPLVLDGMCGILRSWGCRVRTAASGAAALDAAAEDSQPPDLIISDYRLSDGETGIEAVEALREAFSTVVPAFLITGDTAPERLREASAAGFHLLHKPVSPMALRTTLGRLLKPQAAESQSALKTPFEVYPAP
jgi:two-component system, sensor histidine kinase